MGSRPRSRNPEPDSVDRDGAEELDPETARRLGWLGQLTDDTPAQEADRKGRRRRLDSMATTDQVDRPNGQAPTAQLDRISPNEHPLAALMTWLSEHDEAVNNLLLSRAHEYGSGDLEIMAAAMDRMFPSGIVTDPGHRAIVAKEMVCAFYALGKIGRMWSAYEAGQVPSTDNWFDIEGYAKMAQKIRETGTWTG